MTQKIQGKFYPLTPETMKRLRKANLSRHEMNLWLYLTELDPYGDRYSLLPNAMEIMTELKMSKATYFRAKARLQELELYDFQEEKVSFRNLTGVSFLRLESQKRDSESQKRDSESQKRDSESQKRDSESQKRDCEPPELLPDKDYSTSQTIQTYSNFIQTLSEKQRENFLKFGLKKAAELPKPPILPERWISVNFAELYLQFRAEVGEVISPSQDWANHPRREEWIEEIRKGKGSFIVNGGPSSEKQTRIQFAQWACVNNLVWGLES